MTTEKLTAKAIVQKGIKPQTPLELMRVEILDRIEKGAEAGTGRAEMLQSLYPNTQLDGDVLETVTTALLAGSNILFYGPSGSGKTTLAKDIWNLYPKKIFVVDGCPVHDNPFSVFDPEFSKVNPACPFCKSRFGALGIDELGDFQPSKILPENVPVRLTSLREGSGFSRIQGSAEVFPDNLTGTLNLRKLEEIGDPTSPLVLEPGKLLQANRGVFIADEIGKLPVGTQNVLLQALQESIVSPAKSRETFPAAFLAIATSNNDDLDSITPPLNARLVSIHIGYNKEHANNRKIVELALKRRSAGPFLPSFLIDCGIHIIEEWRRVFGEADGSEVGSNRTMLDITSRSEARAMLDGNSTVALAEFRGGVRESLTGRIWVGGSNPQAKERLDSFISKNVDRLLGRTATAYWCRFFKGTLNSDKSEGKRIADELKLLLKDQGRAKDYLEGKAEFRKADRWKDFVSNEEKYPGQLSEKERALTVFAMLDALGIFEPEPAC